MKKKYFLNSYEEYIDYFILPLTANNITGGRL